MFVLVLLVIQIIIEFILGMFAGFRGVTVDSDPVRAIVLVLFAVAIFIPALAISVRRLHDVGKSGWLNLIVFVPVAGMLYLIYLFTKKGDAVDNQYGPALQ